MSDGDYAGDIVDRYGHQWSNEPNVVIWDTRNNTRDDLLRANDELRKAVAWADALASGEPIGEHEESVALAYLRCRELHQGMIRQDEEIKCPETIACSHSRLHVSNKGSESTGLERGATETGDAVPIGNAGMAWQDAMKRAEEHVRAHDGAFPSVKRLAEIVGCSRPTMGKAIEGSRYLKARKAEKVQSPRMQRLDDRAVEQTGTAQYEQSKREEHADWHKEDLDRLIAEQAADLARDERQAKASSKGRS